MKPTTKRKVKGKKTYVGDETFGNIVKSLEEIVAYELGEKPPLRVTRVAVPPKSPIKMSKQRGNHLRVGHALLPRVQWNCTWNVRVAPPRK